MASIEVDGLRQRRTLPRRLRPLDLVLRLERRDRFLPLFLVRHVLVDIGESGLVFVLDLNLGVRPGLVDITGDGIRDEGDGLLNLRDDPLHLESEFLETREVLEFQVQFAEAILEPQDFLVGEFMGQVRPRIAPEFESLSNIVDLPLDVGLEGQPELGLEERELIRKALELCPEFPFGLGREFRLILLKGKGDIEDAPRDIALEGQAEFGPEIVGAVAELPKLLGQSAGPPPASCGLWNSRIAAVDVLDLLLDIGVEVDVERCPSGS